MLIPEPLPEGPRSIWPQATVVLTLSCALAFGWVLTSQSLTRPAVDAAVERLERAVAASPEGRFNSEELERLPDRWRAELASVTDDDGPSDPAMSAAARELRERVSELPAWRFGWIPAMPTPHGWLSYIFVHTQWFHLLANLTLLWILGATLERRCSPRLMVSCFLFAGAVGAWAHAGLYSASMVPLVGASAAVAGVFGGLGVAAPSRELRFKLWARSAVANPKAGIVIPTGALLLIWIGLESLVFLEAERAPSALAAHACGAVTGALIALVWRRRLPSEAQSPKSVISI